MVVIRLKSGFEMRVDCETFKLKANPVTGELTNAYWDGCKNIRPMFFRYKRLAENTKAEGEGDE